MARRTRRDLDQLAEAIDVALGLPGDTHQIISAYGQPRLFRDEGSVEVSPRLPTGQLFLWMSAYRRGIFDGRDSMKPKA